MFESVAQAICESTGLPFRILKSHAIGGGCINSAYHLEGDGLSFFVKLNQSQYLPMFEAEALGLGDISASKTIRVPEPICTGIAGNQAYLVMEYLNLRSGRGSADRLLGMQLAELHKIRQPFFGWHRDNTIGSTAQCNSKCNDWPSFWAQHRLGFQLDLAAKNGHGGQLQRKGGRLLEQLPCFFKHHKPMPSLLHGDLWGGNFSSDASGQPVIFDPACYYGDREADIAMTELFSGFGQDFYAAYRDAFPLDQDYAVRKTLYNLYHILNHLNLFGRGYLSQADSMIDRLLAEAS